MGKILVIAEKPSVARDIAKVLQAKQKGEGCLIGERYVVSWAVGHLVTLAEPEEYDEKYKKWNFSTLPILPEEMQLKAIKQTRDQLKILHSWMHKREIDSLICATDSGREGELIFRYIYEITKCKKPFQRLWISSMTEEAIKEGFRALKDGREYDLLYTSAKCRSEADWLVGMNATRAYTLQYHALLSIGRVQTPTLALIVERQKEIDAFTAEDYFEVQADFGGYTGLWIDREEHTRIDREDAAQAILAKTNGKPATITKVEKEEKKTPPPLLYDLTELQRECNRKFGFSAKKTLDIAQSLYEKRKMITYPRTDSRYLSEDMKGKVKSTIHRLQALEEYAPYAEPLMQEIRFTKRIIDNAKVTDHHAIIPTDGKLRPESLSEDERKVFSLVAARFLAVFYPYYRYEVTKVYAEAEQERFLSKGTVVLEEGWQAVEKALVPTATKKKKTKNEEEQKLPSLQEGEVRTIRSMELLRKKTKPPAPYTESSLLSAMERAGNEELTEDTEKKGLGTPATRAAIIEKLIQSGFVKREKKNLVPTDDGNVLITVLPDEIKSPKMTAEWEMALNHIAQNTETADEFLNGITELMQELVARYQGISEEKKNQFQGKAKGEVIGKCPRCGADVREGKVNFYCSDRNCAFALWKNDKFLASQGKKMDKVAAKKFLSKGKIHYKDLVSRKTGRQYEATVEMVDPGEGNVQFNLIFPQR